MHSAHLPTSITSRPRPFADSWRIHESAMPKDDKPDDGDGHSVENSKTVYFNTDGAGAAVLVDGCCPLTLKT